MRRREFIQLIGGAAAAWPLAAQAQRPDKIAKIGYLDLGPASARAGRVEALRAGLRDLGYVEGKNIAILGPQQIEMIPFGAPKGYTRSRHDPLWLNTSNNIIKTSLRECVSPKGIICFIGTPLGPPLIPFAGAVMGSPP